MTTKQKDSAEKAIRDIRRVTRRQYSAEEKIRIVLEGLRGESSIVELCRKEGINQNLYYRWSKEFRLLGEMNGENILIRPWGDVLLSTTMAKRGAPDEMILASMLEYGVPQSEQNFDGELKAPGIVVYWRVGPAAQTGKLNVVLARKCERETEFDNWVSLSTSYPGQLHVKTNVNSALQEVNSLFRCHFVSEQR